MREQPTVVTVDPDGWQSRVGEEATQLIYRAVTLRRVGVVSGFTFVVVAIAFEFDNFYRPGIEASVLFMIAFIGASIGALRRESRARRIVAARLGLPDRQAKYVPLRSGPAGFDRWVAARTNPGWPVKGWR